MNIGSSFLQVLED